MALTYTLLDYAGDFRAFKAQIAARYSGITLEQPKFTVGVDNVTAEFLALSPAGKVPVLVTEDGALTQSNAIARFLARHRNDTGLTGSSLLESAQVDQWIDWCLNELELPAVMWLFPIFGWMPNDIDRTNAAKKDVLSALTTLDAHLADCTFLVGNAVTLADIIVVSTLVSPFKMVLDANQRKRFPHLLRYFTTLINLPHFKAVLDEVPLCRKMQAAPVPKGGAAKGAKKGAKKGGDKPLTKKEKKAAAAKAAAAKPKKKKSGRIVHRLDALPKSKLGMSMMGWKSVFANSKKSPFQAMEWFWAHFDDSVFSIWFQKFKHNEENVNWMVSNQLAGFTQRTDGLRKWAMGAFTAMDTLAAKGFYEVEGVWLFKGTDMQEMIEQNPEAELYNWTKLTPAMLADPAVRQRVNNFWAGEGHDGVRWYQSNFFY